MGISSDRTKTLDKEGYCLLCNEKKENRCRGLCPRHYKQFHKERSAMSEEKQMEFEECLIQKGYLLPCKKRGRRAERTVFEEIKESLGS